MIADEIHAPLTLGEAVFTPYLSLDARGFAAVSASKAWNLAGLKTAMLVAGPAVVSSLERADDDASSSTGILGVIGSVAALTEGEEWLDSLRAALEVNRRVLAAELSSSGVGFRTRRIWPGSISGA
ncbi:aminotransferase class I/II-fold pyridoxal phosphate-dependent enzyme [Cryptosporangium sp. NPDC051539]|uniref:aminotransferase class I/II-fold pyridoxal phosphate-dependent enzyme n=1 Tax=Cryptosporangium sp. NPDC051539 TaxID=3363962 RepID=UPI00379460BC